MTLLLDTHTLLWSLTAPPRLPQSVRAAIEHADTHALTSVVSLWELVIKASIGKLDSADPFDEVILAELHAHAIGVLPIRQAHLIQLRKLPLHHRDPFDRLILAQAIAEHIPVVSRDTHFAAYDAEVLWG